MRFDKTNRFNFIFRQFQKLEDVIVTHQVDSGNVSDCEGGCSSRSRSRSSPNGGLSKNNNNNNQDDTRKKTAMETSCGWGSSSDNLLEAMKKHTPKVDDEHVAG